MTDVQGENSDLEGYTTEIAQLVQKNDQVQQIAEKLTDKLVAIKAAMKKAKKTIKEQAAELLEAEQKVEQLQLKLDQSADHTTELQEKEAALEALRKQCASYLKAGTKHTIETDGNQGVFLEKLNEAKAHQDVAITQFTNLLAQLQSGSLSAPAESSGSGGKVEEAAQEAGEAKTTAAVLNKEDEEASKEAFRKRMEERKASSDEPATEEEAKAMFNKKTSTVLERLLLQAGLDPKYRYQSFTGKIMLLDCLKTQEKKMVKKLKRAASVNDLTEQDWLNMEWKAKALESNKVTERMKEWLNAVEQLFDEVKGDWIDVESLAPEKRKKIWTKLENFFQIAATGSKIEGLSRKPQPCGLSSLKVQNALRPAWKMT